MAKKKNEDVEETETWSCTQCGASGTAAKGQGNMAMAAHIALAHPPPKKK